MIKETKRALLRIFFSVEIVVCTLFYVFGSQGFQSLYRLQHENTALEEELLVMRAQTHELHQQINAWQTHAFYKEKKAREQLQMARQGDTIFYIS